MDRTSGAEVGGPYANRDDAQRAIERGGFDQDPAELVVTSDDGGDDGGDEPEPKEGMRRHAVPQAPQGPNPPMGFSPHETPQTPATKGPADPGVPPLPRVVPDGVVPTKTTKPAQTPGGTSPMDGSSLPSDPNSEQFEAAPTSSKPAADLSAVSALRSLAALVRRDNPGVDEDSVARIVAKVAGFADVPFIEDPLAERNPLKLTEDVIKDLVKVKQHGPQQVRDTVNRYREDARWQFQRRLPQRFQQGEEEGGQRTLFPEPPRMHGQPERAEEPERQDRPQRPMRGQQTLFDDPDEVQDPPEQPAPPARRRRPPRPRPLPGENDPPPPPDLNRFDQPEDPPEGPGGQQGLFDPARMT